MKIIVLSSVLCTLCLFLTRPCLAQLSTGAAAPGTAANTALGGSSFFWNNPSGAKAAGGGTASSSTLLAVNSGTTDYLQVTNFGFALPVGSTINGITVNITEGSSGLSLTLLGITINGSVNDNIVRLVGPGVTSVNKATGAAWPGSLATVTYGSAADVWGPTVWTAAMVNSAAFGVDISAVINGGVLFGINLVPGASIDAVTVNITYSLPVTLALHLDQWSVTRQGRANQLSWQAATDAAPGAFIVERSANGTNWTSIATIDATAGTTDSASNPAGNPAGNPGPQLYLYADEEPFATGPTYYRLRLHTDGQPDRWSAVQVLSARSANPVISLYPNPFHNMINLSAPGTFTQLTLRNNQGATIWVKEFPGGINSTQIPVAGLPQGLYFLTIDGATYTLVKD